MTVVMVIHIIFPFSRKQIPHFGNQRDAVMMCRDVKEPESRCCIIVMRTDYEPVLERTGYWSRTLRVRGHEKSTSWEIPRASRLEVEVQVAS